VASAKRPPAVVEQQVRIRRLSVAVGLDPPAHEEVQVAVAVHIGHLHARLVRTQGRQCGRVGREGTPAVVAVQPVLQGRVALPKFIATGHDVQIQVAVAVGIEENRCDIFGGRVPREGRLGGRYEGTIGALHEQLTSL
jgi:hypothetical protein